MRSIRFLPLFVGAVTCLGLAGCGRDKCRFADAAFFFDAGTIADGGRLADGGATVEDGGATDAAGSDGGEAVDGSIADGGEPTDGGSMDAGPMDAGPTDAGPTDAGPTDAGPMVDGGPCDGGRCWPVPERGLVAHFRLDGDARNGVSGGVDGVRHGTVASGDRFGNTNGALLLSAAASDYVDALPDALLPVGAAPRTVSLWFKTPMSSAGYQAIVNWGTSSTGQRFGISTVGSGIMFTGQYDDVRDTVSNVMDDAWHLVAVTYDGTTVQLWLDGVMVGEDPKTLNTTGQSLLIGRKLGTTGEHFEGAIDDIRIYDRALSDAELAMLYGAGGWR